jgi:ATP-dependent DNA helicase PIF1
MSRWRAQVSSPGRGAHRTAPARETGQAYVAFSRVRTLTGLYLTDFAPRCVRAHPAALRFYAAAAASASIDPVPDTVPDRVPDPVPDPVPAAVSACLRAELPSSLTRALGL